MEPIPANWDLIHQSSKLEIYSYGEYQIRIYFKSVQWIIYYWKEVVIIDLSVTNNHLDMIRILPKDTKFNLKEVDYEKLTRTQERLMPPFWNHMDYFISISLAIKKVYLRIYNYNDKIKVFFDNPRIDIPLSFDFNLMRFYLLPNKFLGFDKNFVIISDEVIRRGDYFSEDLLRKLVTQIDNFFKLIEEILPQPIAEEIIPHLLNPCK